VCGYVGPRARAQRLHPADCPHRKCTTAGGGGPASFRKSLQAIYTGELGVREASGNNDGERVGAYLRYTGLPEGYSWCAAFVCWCYGKAGRAAPRNPWAPALFPERRVIWKSGKALAAPPQPGDVFGIWNNSLHRIAHVGFIDGRQGGYFLTVEGNSGNAVRRLRRKSAGIYRVADWVRQ